jgi:transcriptional regulator with XRE-family HTH domain
LTQSFTTRIGNIARCIAGTKSRYSLIRREKVADRNLQQLSAILRRERARSGYTVRELAEKADLVPSTVSRLESGLVAEPRPSHLQKLAQALGIDVEELYAEAGYLVPGTLPELGAYLRVKYGLGKEDVTRIEGYVEATRQANQPRKEGRHDGTRDKAP